MNILGFVLKCCIVFECQGFGWGGGKRGGFYEELLSAAEALTHECSKVRRGIMAFRGIS